MLGGGVGSKVQLDFWEWNFAGHLFRAGSWWKRGLGVRVDLIRRILLHRPKDLLRSLWRLPIVCIVGGGIVDEKGEEEEE